MARIVIGGDFCPQNRISRLSDDRIVECFSDIKSVFDDGDYSILNLETPILYDRRQYMPLKKSGPNLRCYPDDINILKYLNVDLVTLANNHIMDYGSQGLSSTIALLASNGIEYVGAGNNLKEAKKGKIKEINGEIVAFISCCEREYSIASEDTAGANPVDDVDLYYAIKELRAQVDYIIVIVHGGIEYYHLPSPNMQKRYRFLIDCGASAVINHHQHCYSGYEIYHNSPILYGLGNFCFDWYGKVNQPWNYGYLVKIELEETISIELIPYVQNSHEAGVKRLVAGELDILNDDVNRLNGIIKNPKELNSAYRDFLKNTEIEYKNVISPYSGKYLSALFRRKLLPSFFPQKKWLMLLDMLTCDAHADRFTEYVKKKAYQ